MAVSVFVYAVIENSFVINLIEWDGVLGDFPTAIQDEDLGAMIGDVYMNETLYAKPRNDFMPPMHLILKKWNGFR